MRAILLFLLAALMVGLSTATWSTQCTEVCDPITYTGVAVPNCTDPVCEIICETSTPDEACDDIEETIEKCRVRCDTTACFNTTPPCEVQCKRPPECETESNCTIGCEELTCNWILLPGPAQPEPECNITCEAVTCDSSMTVTTPTGSSGSRFSLFSF